MVSKLSLDQRLIRGIIIGQSGLKLETTRNFYVNEICFFCFCLLHSAAMMGLMLHAKAKSLIETDLYVDALEVLAMAEVSCNFLLAGNQFFHCLVSDLFV